VGNGIDGGIDGEFAGSCVVSHWAQRSLLRTGRQLEG
jgi:hypothetical protein